jgi:NTP pyrophosphatase (non-canonical NTP hydrolase)
LVGSKGRSAWLVLGGETPRAARPRRYARAADDGWPSRVNLGMVATVTAMECDDYQRAAMRTARDESAPDEFMHLVLGLVGEAGEIAEKVKKLVRDKNGDLARLDRDDMAAELGDVLWYTAVLANFLGLSLDDVARRNVDKLADRQRRAVLGGSGDNR